MVRTANHFKSVQAMDQILVIRASTAGLVFRLLSSRERNEYRRAVRQDRAGSMDLSMGRQHK